jgi:hypothetical protein
MRPAMTQINFQGGNIAPIAALSGHTLTEKKRGGDPMGRGLLLWLIGIPLPIILIVWLLGGLN